MRITSQFSTGSSVPPRLLLGVGLVVLGGALLLDRLGLFEASSILRLWPIILIAIGLQQFFTPRIGEAGERIFPVGGVIWIAVGGIFLLNSLNILRTSVWSLFWPVLLIAVGVRLMSRSGLAIPGFDKPAGGSAADTGAIVAVLSGVKRVSAPITYAGNDVTVFMGGVHLDLRDAKLPPNGEAVIDLFAVIGGCELRLPAEWVVSAPVVAILGGIEDRRIAPPPNVIDATAGAAAPPRLVIRGTVLMGGVTIRL